MTFPLLSEQLVQAEQAVLGSMLIDQEVVGPCLQKVGPEDFISERHGAVFQAIRRLYSQGKPLDPLTVNDQLGGRCRELLAALIDGTPTSANWEIYADLLRQAASLYRLRELGAQLAEAADSERAQALADSIAAAGCARPSVRIASLRDCFQDFLDRHGEGTPPAYFSWGIPELDQRVYVEPGDFVVLGGYPSAGKTALALQMACHIAREKRVGYFYLENSGKKLFDRIVTARTGVSFRKIKRYGLEEADFAAIAAARQRLVQPALELVDAAGMTVQDLRAVALSRRYDLAAVDYLQKLQAPAARRSCSEFERVSEVSSGLQQLGRQTGVTVLALSQLSRPAERRDGRLVPPDMHAFRQSGQIEQDADVALLLYRQSEDPRQTGRMLSIGKNKEGEAHVHMALCFDGDRQTFRRPQAGEAV